MGESGGPFQDVAGRGRTSPPMRHSKFHLFSVISVVVFFASVIALQQFASNWSWKNEHIYAVLDGTGGGIAVFFGLMLLLVRPYRTHGSYLVVVASSFIAMGLVQTVNLFVLDPHLSVWLDCLSISIGALLLAALWFPRTFVEKCSRNAEHWIIAIGVLLPMALSVGVVTAGASLLPPLIDRSLPDAIKLITLLSGLFFILSKFRIFRVIENPERLAIAVICLYTGLGALTLPFIRIWGPRWWLVQIVEVVPYLGAMAVLRNFLTGQKLLFQSEERFRTLVKAAPIGVGVVSNEDNTLVQSNPALCEMLGYSEKELAKTNVNSLIHPEDVHDEFEERKKLMRGEAPVYRSERRYLTKNSQTIWVRASGALIKSKTGTPQEVRIIENITDEKSARDRAKVLMEELARTNAELERFTSIASHDLKAPLRTIRMYVQLLSKKLGDGPSPEAKDYLAFIANGSSQLSSLIDDLLTYSRISRDTHHFDRTACSAIVKEVLESLRFDVESCGGTVSVESLPTVMGDRLQLLQLFQNLVSNGLKYRGDRQPKICISAEEQKEEWLFSVSDNGIGFSMDDAGKIFAEFQRLHSIQEYPGTGLGLPICKTIVKRHGGRIWAQSALGQGATFFFTLPKEGRQDASRSLAR